jgi:nicotinamidase-related amidase
LTDRSGHSRAGQIVPGRCCGVIIDVQDFFLSQAGEGLRCKIIAHTGSFARLLAYYRIPIVVTLERPVDQKGSCPREIMRYLGDMADLFEKDFFDLTKERQIRDHLDHLKKTQILVTGCETDVCVLQSCLGLLSLDYEVYLVEELLFSSSPNVESAVARMQSAGAVLVSYKTLYYELLGSVRGNGFSEELEEQFGPLPEDLPDSVAG